MKNLRLRVGWMKIFFLLYFMLAAIPSVFAAWGDGLWKMSLNKNEGILQIEFQLFQTFNGGGNHGYQGWAPHRGGFTLEALGHTIKGTAYENTSNISIPENSGITYSIKYVGDDWKPKPSAVGEYSPIIVFKIPLNDSHLGPQKVKLSGTWWIEDMGRDNEFVSESHDIDIKIPLTIHEYIGSLWGFDKDTVPVHQVAVDQGAKDNTEEDKLSEWRYDYSKDPACSKIYVFTRNGNRYCNFYISDKNKIAQSGEVEMYRVYNKGGHIYKKASAGLYLRKAYPQPISIDVDVDRKTGRIKATAKLSPLNAKDQTNGRYEPDRVAIEFVARENKPNGKVLPKHVEYLKFNPKNNTYVAYYNIGDINHIVNVMVGREHWYKRYNQDTHKCTWLFAKNSKSLSLSHYDISNVNVVLTEDKKFAKITWDTHGNYWSDGASLNIIRHTLDTKTGHSIAQDTIAKLDKAGFDKKVYMDAPKAFLSYKYEIQMGASQYYPTKPFQSETIISPYVKGNIVDISASKGYFGDKVNVAWSNDASVDGFEIYRRAISGKDNSFVLQVSLNGGDAGKKSWVDHNAVAGIVYEYKVEGLTKQELVSGTTIHRSEAKTIGFCMPTGSVYGQITYGTGSKQAVKGVSVKLSTIDNKARGYAVKFAGGVSDYLESDDIIRRTADNYTFQLYVRPEVASQTAKLMTHGAMELGLKEGKPYLKVSETDFVEMEKVLPTDSYSQITAGYKKTGDGYVLNLTVYDSEKVFKQLKSNVPMHLSESKLRIAGGFQGWIDEVRVWDKALTNSEVDYTHDKMLNCGEDSLVAYYRLNEAVEGFFYDGSHVGDIYNENHGTFYGNVVYDNSSLPTESQLSYCSLTDNQGNYNVKGVPFYGKSGTEYSVIPHLGIHQFTMENGNVKITKEQPDHIVNIVDNSSFKITGVIYYENSTIPVKEVCFLIDDTPAFNADHQQIMTGADGTFSLDVPIGVHKVRATKAHHTFVNDGYLQNQYGMDFDYQEPMTNLRFWDNTRVRLIGKVVGGDVEGAKPVGHSLTKNNLGDDIVLTLKLGAKQEFANAKIWNGAGEARVDSLKHLDSTYVNVVRETSDRIYIKANEKTGEYVADLIPEKYSIVSLTVSGYEPFLESGDLDLSEAFMEEESLYPIPGDKQEKVDTVFYNKEFSHVYEGQPVFDIYEVLPKVNGKASTLNDFAPKPHFGDANTAVSFIGDDGKFINDTVPLYDVSTREYLLGGKPVYTQNGTYHVQCNAYRIFCYNNTDVKIDTIPMTNVKVTITNGLSTTGNTTIDLGEKGKGIYSFVPDNPDVLNMSNGIQTCFFNFAAGTTSSKKKVEAYVLGGKSSGQDFVTDGPSELLMVLRDPPGSNSYAYTAKDLTVSAYFDDTRLGWYQEGDNSVAALTGMKFETTKGTPFFSVITEDVNTDNQIGATVSHNESAQDNVVDSYTYTFSQAFQTSSDPDYVGRDADLLIGNSTNMLVGWQDNIGIKLARHVEEGNRIATLKGTDYVLCTNRAIGLRKGFKTLFAYPQIHIEEVLIPKIGNLIKGMLDKGRGLTLDEALATANETNEAVYIPKLDSKDENFGKPNPDGAFLNQASTPNYFQGEFYDIVYPSNDLELLKQNKKILSDSILTLNDNIVSWERLLAENEETKVKAFNNSPTENISFQAGAIVERSKSYTTADEKRHSFSFQVGAGVFGELSARAWRIGTKMTMDERAGKVGGYEKSESSENTKTIGFVLEDSGTDYFSVDVHEVKQQTLDAFSDESDKKGYHKDIYTDYVFRLRGGATAAPYEGEQLTEYFEPKQHVLSYGSLQIEKPTLKLFSSPVLENVPSNEVAVFDLGLANMTETDEDCYFDLSLDDSSNPYGAKISIDGVPLGDGRSLLVPVKEFMHKTVEVAKGSKGFDFANLKLLLSSQEQGDPTSWNGAICDSVRFSAHFVPASTKVNVKYPEDGWILNVKSNKMKSGGAEVPYIPVRVDGFNANEQNFVKIEIQFKPVSSADGWNVLRTFFKKKSDITDPESQDSIGNKSYLDANFVGFQDEAYDIRAVSYTRYGDELVTYVSNVVRGVKDLQCPKLFGEPKPGDGILNIGDEIRLDFNEDIAGGLLGINNFDITAVKNGMKSDRSVSVKLDGVNDVITSLSPKDWSNRSLTFEGWIYMDALDSDQGIMSVGDVNNGMSVSYLNKQGASTFSFASQQGAFQVDFSAPELKAKEWAHLAAVIDYDARKVYMYLNGQSLGEGIVNKEYRCDGKMVIGQDFSARAHLAGRVDEFRIWDKPISGQEMRDKMNKRMSGNESSLIAYYPMNEARGQLLLDKARGNNATLNGNWTTPASYAYSFDGVDDAISILRDKGYGSVQFDALQDFTIDFWFKTAGAANGNATMLSSGSAVSELTNGEFLIGFENGKLVVRADGKVNEIAGDYDDQNWQHFVMTVNRNGGYAKVFMNERLVTYFDCKQIKGFDGKEMYIGARLNRNVPEKTVTADQFFAGLIDEIRIWNCSFLESTLDVNVLNKLDGKEFGLVAYYPFEEWKTNLNNITELLPMNLDLVSGEAFTFLGAPTSSNVDHAPIVDLGKEDFVAYDFVVNKDALIIKLTEPEDRIDNTIVNFAVKNVRDIHGNEMDEAIRWSALINRNPIRWSEGKKDIAIDSNKGTDFIIALNNTSGEAKNFTLEGLPSWIEASPAYGKLEANSSEDIHFTISDGANIGRYNEVVYARGDNNVAAALPLNIKINGQRPDWKVDAGKYEHNLSIFGQMLFNGALSNDAEDMVGVFKNGECVGVGNSTYDKKRDMWYTYITVYASKVPMENTDLKDVFEFRMWDASTGQLYAGVVNSLMAKNGICGSLVDLVQISGKELKFRNLNLMEGWNWVSFAALPDQHANSNSVLKNGVWTKNDIVKSANGFDNYVESTGLWTGTLGESYSRAEMYLLHSSAAQSLNIMGVENSGTEISVKGNKWNYIGYTPMFNMTVSEALAGYAAVEGDVIKSQTDFAMYTDGDWVGSLRYMEANRGYMLFRNAVENTAFSYPLLRGAYSNKMRSAWSMVDNSNKYSGNLTIVATPVYDDLQEGDLIKAYVNGELRGTSHVINYRDHEVHFLSVAGENESEDVVFTLERDGEVVAKSHTVVPFAVNASHGTVTKAFEISFNEGDDAVSVYPNPFVSHLNIKFFAEDAGTAEISVYDLSGRCILHKSVDAHAGMNVFTWNGKTDQSAQCAGGVHLVQVKVDGKTSVHEVIKK